ncbi:MAG: hypothetical protein CMJ86_03340 [Planctomycetes bacterium]|nr:hypothetical protein [Planctomycetota bacterium]
MERILKQSPRRTVLLMVPAQAMPGPGRVIKRYHAPEFLGGLRDQRRAQKEFQTLVHLRELGLAAPKPLEVRLQREHWELVMEEIPGALNLEQVFAQNGARYALAAALAKFLYQLLVLEVRHDDLHPGNVVLDEQDKLWLVDMRGIRRDAPYGKRELRELLIHLCQTCRETTSARWRASVMARLRRCCNKGQLAHLVGNLDLPAIETSARTLRRKRGRKRIGRWQRESSAATRRGAGWLALDRNPGDWIRTPPASLDQALDCWNSLGHLAEHGIPAERPVLLWVGSRSVRVVSQIPTGARRMKTAKEGSPGAWGHILGSIADRGLGPEASNISQWWLTREGAILAGDIHLLDLSRAEQVNPWRFNIEGFNPSWTPDQRREFSSAWCLAHACGPQEQQVLKEALLGDL